MNSFLQFAGEVEKAGIWLWKGHSQEIIFSLLYSRRSWAMQPPQPCNSKQARLAEFGTA